MRIDHVVLWVADPLRSVEWYARVLAVEGVRVEQFRAGEAPFPSVRLADDALIDLMPLALAARMNGLPGAAGSAGNKINHVCLALERPAYEALRARLDAEGVAIVQTMHAAFGARGHAPEAIYFADPDGNVLEARHYG